MTNQHSGMRNFLIFFILVNFLSVTQLLAQDQCTVSLNEAEDKYDQGRLYEIPEMLQSCLSEGFSKEQKIRAYRLLTLTYLLLDYYEEADKTYLELLKLSPEYTTNEELDPMELINHSEKFTTKPIFYLTLGKVGVNYSFANVLLDYSLSSSNNNSSKYSSNFGFDLGLGAEMVLIQNLHIAAEIYYSRKSVHLKDTHWDFYTTNMDIVHSDIEVPIMLKYNFFRGKVNPFVLGGVKPEFLLGSSIQKIEGVYLAESEDDPGNFEEYPARLREKINTNEMRNRFNYSMFLGAGLNYKIGLNYIVFEARYAMGMLNVTNVKNRWREDFTDGRDLKFPPGQVNDDFKLNSLSVLIGFVKPLYKPRKIK